MGPGRSCWLLKIRAGKLRSWDWWLGNPRLLCFMWGCSESWGGQSSLHSETITCQEKVAYNLPVLLCLRNISEWGGWYWVALTYAGFPRIPAVVREGLPCSWPFNFRWCLRTLLTVWAKLGQVVTWAAWERLVWVAACGSVPVGWGELVSLSVLNDCHSFLWGKRGLTLTRKPSKLCETEAAVWEKVLDLRKSSKRFWLVKKVLVHMTIQAAEMLVHSWVWIWSDLTSSQCQRFKMLVARELQRSLVGSAMPLKLMWTLWTDRMYNCIYNGNWSPIMTQIILMFPCCWYKWNFGA